MHNTPLWGILMLSTGYHHLKPWQSNIKHTAVYESMKMCETVIHCCTLTNSDTVSVCLVWLYCGRASRDDDTFDRGQCVAMCGNVWQGHITGKTAPCTSRLAAIETGAAMLYWPALRSSPFRLLFFTILPFTILHLEGIWPYSL